MIIIFKNDFFILPFKHNRNGIVQKERILNKIITFNPAINNINYERYDWRFQNRKVFKQANKVS